MNLIFDTETTGHVDFKAPRDAPHQPHLVEIAAILADDDGTEYASMQFIIRPEGYTIPDEVTKIHGITTDIALKHGVALRRAMLVFSDLCGIADQLIAHNLNFDEKVLKIAFGRLDGWPPKMPAFNFCTAVQSTKIVNLPPSPAMVAKGMRMAKTPSLEECIKFFFNEDVDTGGGAHTALYDARQCQRVYGAIQAHRAANGEAIGLDRAAATAPVKARLPERAAVDRPFDPNDPFGDGRV